MTPAIPVLLAGLAGAAQAQPVNPSPPVSQPQPAARAEPERKPAQGDEEPELRYLLGAQLVSQPDGEGASSRELKLRPLFALRWGRWRISSSSAGSMLGFGRGAAGPGASTELLRRGDLRLGVALRMDNGRNSSRSENTAGLPDVKRTLRARFYGSWNFAPDWQWSAALSQDLLGHKGGMVLNTDLSWRLWHAPGRELSIGAGLTGGDARNLRSYFGVPEGHPRWPAYQPGAGLRDVHAGVGWLMSLGPHWVLSSGVGVSRMLGPAADSPIVERRNAWQASIGLGWRN